MAEVQDENAGITEGPRNTNTPNSGTSGGGLDPNAFSGATDRAAVLGPGHILSGQFRVVRPVGRGGMGVVYEVRDLLTGEPFALKTLLPSCLYNANAARRFIREIRTARRLNHPNIVAVYDVRQDGPLLFYTMELLEGRSLRAQMQERGRFELADAVRILRQLCDALGYAHQFMVHRDISPENVMLLSDGRVKLLDFGLARNLGLTTMTAEGVRLGKAQYMAPEQRLDAAHVDARADIYALGVMFFELITGQLPLGYQRATDIVPGLPPACDILCASVLCPVDERLPDIGAFRLALERCLAPSVPMEVEAGEDSKADSETAVSTRPEWQAALAREFSNRRDLISLALNVFLPCALGCYLVYAVLSAAPPAAAYRMPRPYGFRMLASLLVVCILCYGPSSWARAQLEKRNTAPARMERIAVPAWHFLTTIMGNIVLPLFFLAVIWNPARFLQAVDMLFGSHFRWRIVANNENEFLGLGILLGSVLPVTFIINYYLDAFAGRAPGFLRWSRGSAASEGISSRAAGALARLERFGGYAAAAISVTVLAVLLISPLFPDMQSWAPPAMQRYVREFLRELPGIDPLVNRQ